MNIQSLTGYMYVYTCTHTHGHTQQECLEELVNLVKIQRMDNIWTETRNNRSLQGGVFRERGQGVRESGHEKVSVVAVLLLRHC